MDKTTFWITFRHDGGKVIAAIDTATKVEFPVWPFEFNTSPNAAAEVMARHLEDQWRTIIEQIHKAAYQAGRKDGRAKVAQRTYFRYDPR